MKKAFAVSLILTVISLSAIAQEHSRPTPDPTPKSTSIAPPEGWVNFTSDNGHFSVLLPEIPPEKSETTQSEHGPYTTHLFLVRGAPSFFLIGWVDYDPSFNFNKSSELEANRDNFIKGIKATLVTTRSLMIDGYQSLEFTAETEDRVWKSRVYMVGRRPYQLVAGTPKGMDDTVNVERFFGSFKVSAR